MNEGDNMPALEPLPTNRRLISIGLRVGLLICGLIVLFGKPPSTLLWIPILIGLLLIALDIALSVSHRLNSRAVTLPESDHNDP